MASRVSGAVAVAALLAATTSSVAALRASPLDLITAPASPLELDISPVAPPPHFAGPPGAPPTPPHNGSVIVRHRRELGAMDGWQDGRCTWYGGPGGPGPDGMNIFKGSCGYGQVPAPYFVAAAQTMGGYNWGLTGECGKCYEVMCVAGKTRGRNDSTLGPWEGCQDEGRRSVVVKISDSCPCNHPNPSNKRWCCGDEKHLDLSYAAFDVIALRDRGVVDLKMRPVSCDLQGQTVYYSGPGYGKQDGK